MRTPPSRPATAQQVRARASGALRIAVVAACPFPLRRGTPVRIFRIAEALARRGHDVHVATYHLGDEVPAVPFRIHRIPTVRGYRQLAPGPTYRKLLLLDPLLRRTLQALLRQWEFDLIHAHHYEGLLIARSLPRSSRPPVVYDAHTLLSSELPHYSLGLSTRVKRSLGALLDRQLPGQAEYVISVTAALRDRLVEIGATSANRIAVIGSGVELSLFDVPPAPRSGASTIVFAGNLAPYQGIELLLRAFRGVRQRRSDVRLQIITESNFRAYDGLALGLGIRPHIELLNVGFDRLPALLRAADLAVNPRLSCEGIPQKLMNYMAAGCPIVSFAGSAAHLQHGVTGWLIPDADVGAMADGILYLLEDRALASQLGVAAREQAMREYSWEQVAEKVEAVYSRVLTRSAWPSGRIAGTTVAGLATAPENGAGVLSTRRTPVRFTGIRVPLRDARHGRSAPRFERGILRVLFVYDHLGYAGGVVHGLTRYCLNVLPRLNSGGIELTACFLREPHPAADALRRAGVAPIFLSRARWDPGAFTDVLRIARRRRIEIVHAAGQKGILVGCAAARLTGCSTVIHLRDVYRLAPPLRAAMRISVASVDAALGVSEAVCRHAIEEYRVPAARVELLYNGIDLEAFSPPDPRRVQAWRSRQRIAESARTIGIVGRLSAVKGHARLIRLMPGILRRVPRAVLVVVGDGALRRPLEQLATELDLGHAVRFVGQQEDMPTVFGALDAVAIPSDHEGLCYVALEALAVGRPVVAFKVGGLPEALNAGRNGILLQPGDEAGFADALVRVLEDPCLARRLLEGAPTHVQRFSLVEHVHRQREIYFRAADERRRRRRQGARRPLQSSRLPDTRDRIMSSESHLLLAASRFLSRFRAPSP